jgi:16S rRNA (cytidine1402-2'-O)-methyltransferase
MRPLPPVMYIIAAPAVGRDDITLRARRILGEVGVVAADDAGQAQSLLEQFGFAPHVVASTQVDSILRGLGGGDVALLDDGLRPHLSAAGQALVQAVIASGYRVVPVPGPSLPVSALILSGLPTDSFVYLGGLPRQPAACHELLVSVSEQSRTLVALVASADWPALSAGLHSALGPRPLVLVGQTEQGIAEIWRGRAGEVMVDVAGRPPLGPCVLVAGGARQERVSWSREHLLDEVRVRLGGGLGAKELSRQLAAEAGWPRREIYRLAVQIARSLGRDSLGPDSLRPD